MYHYDFSIADLLFRVNSHFILDDLRELRHFKIEHCPDNPPDVEYFLEPLPEHWTVQGNCILEDRQNAIYHWQSEEHRYFYWNVFSKDRFVLLRYIPENPRNCSIYFQSEDLLRIMPQLHLSAFLSPERILLRNNAFFLHSSVISWHGNGILFTAPSGTGKSTQADLWRRLEGAEILNGDRAIIRYQNGHFQAYGSPYAGTSGIYANLSVPIRAIVVLSQAKENTLVPLSPIIAFQKLYAQVTAYAWDDQFVNTLSSLLLELIDKVPIYSLACRPDEGAVEILKNKLK